MRLTRSGLAILIVAIGCFVAGRVFGTLELFLLGAMAAVALLLAMLFTSTTKLSIAISRTATPVRLRVGTPARVDLRLGNRAKRSTPVLRLRDEVEGTRAATLMLAPIAPTAKQRSHTAYRRDAEATSQSDPSTSRSKILSASPARSCGHPERSR